MPLHIILAVVQHFHSHGLALAPLSHYRARNQREVTDESSEMHACVVMERTLGQLYGDRVDSILHFVLIVS